MTTLRAAFCLLSLVPGILGLKVTAGSPCASVCQPSANTTSAEIACLDAQYKSTSIGATFQSCISCELQSTYGNKDTGESDVNWGLYNLRYAFSSCVYDFPESVTNVSTPCLVSCTPLSPALELELQKPDPLTMSTFCGDTAFADNVVSTCEACYGLTSQQAFLANFLESVRYSCHFSTALGSAFAIAPSRIFNSTELPTTTAALTSSATAGASHGIKNLTIIIALPIIGFIIILVLLSICCFFLVRHRRRLAKERSYSHHLHALWNDPTTSTPGQSAWANFAPYQSGPCQASPGVLHPMTSSPNHGSGFDVVDYDGRRYDAGYSKGEFGSHISPGPPVAVPPQAFHFPNAPEKPSAQEQPYFPPPPTQQ